VSTPTSARSLPSLCYEAADGDPILALLLALDFLKEHGRSWRGELETVEAEAA
jgi:hypothetical protein